jgi:hypothetical protein
MLPVIGSFMTAHRLPDVTVVADPDMISEVNQKAIEAAGLSFILGMRVPDVPYVSPSGAASTLARTSRTGRCSLDRGARRSPGDQRHARESLPVGVGGKPPFRRHQ